MVSNLGCSIFLALEITNTNDLTVTKWIQEKLISADISPQNNLLDFQTYIVLETGYPFAFYDLEKIQKKVGSSELHFSIAKANINQEFLASNYARYQLNESNLIIKANNFPISIAGIIEREEYVSSETINSLLIEGSIFNAAKIRQQSKKY